MIQASLNAGPLTELWYSFPFWFFFFWDWKSHVRKVLRPSHWFMNHNPLRCKSRTGINVLQFFKENYQGMALPRPQARTPSSVQCFRLLSSTLWTTQTARARAAPVASFDFFLDLSVMCDLCTRKMFHGLDLNVSKFRYLGDTSRAARQAFTAVALMSWLAKNKECWWRRQVELVEAFLLCLLPDQQG